MQIHCKIILNAKVTRLVKMIIPGLRFLMTSRSICWRRVVSTFALTLIAGLSCLLLMGTPPAIAGIDDDKFEGNIFALYGGNGSLVPPKVTLTDSFKRGKPALLVFYVDDSRDCKQYATVVSQLQAYYGRVSDFMPINVDAIPNKSTYAPTEWGYYYAGVVPQTVLLDQSGKVAFNGKGKVHFERVDDAFRKVFNLLPRSESVELKQRSVNEFNTELAK